MFFGLIFLYFLNSRRFRIVNKILAISLNLIFLSKKKLTSVSLAETITVSNNDSDIGKISKIFTIGNLLLSICLKFKLFKFLRSRILVLIFFCYLGYIELKIGIFIFVSCAKILMRPLVNLTIA